MLQKILQKTFLTIYIYSLFNITGMCNISWISVEVVNVFLIIVFHFHKLLYLGTEGLLIKILFKSNSFAFW